jgi:hypothetical protein
VDYKTRWKPAKKPESLILAGYLHQPPVYLEILKNAPDSPVRDLSADGLLYRAIETEAEEGPSFFSGKAWEAARPELDGKMKGTLEQWARGAFFIVPAEGLGKHCSWCRFDKACRKSHPPSRRRAEHSRERAIFDARHGTEEKKR